nr:uncharacterized protein LOC126055228 [Helicoverpa armigera]
MCVYMSWWWWSMLLELFYFQISFKMSDPETVSESEAKTDASTSTPKKKKQRRMCSFLDVWMKSYSFIKSVPNNKLRALCTLCQKEFSISHGGKNDIEKHQKCNEHQKRERSASLSASLKIFLKTEQMSTQEEKVIAAEVTKAYHSVKHCLSFNSLECDAKLDHTLYGDSKIAEKLTLGRTKASAIAHNVLGPASTQEAVETLQKDTFYSISTDASNHGATKMFPLMVRFYSPNTNLKTCVLDFYEDAHETASAIYENLVTRLKEHNIGTKHLTSYCADNANVNFGCRNSVFQLLHHDNDNILSVGCPAHILHNSVKYSLGKSKFDLENFILKLHNHFSYHAKRVAALKDFYEMREAEFAPVLRHVKTRWLSLLPAVERATKSFHILKDYFISLEEDECPTALWQFFNSDETEPYLTFYQNSLKVLQDAVLRLENETLLCFEGHEIMVELGKKLRQRIEDEFVGFTCSNLFKKLPADKVTKIKNECCTWYKNVLHYIETKYELKDSKLDLFKPFSLQDDSFSYASMVKIIENCKIDSFFDMDQLYEEVCNVKEVVKAAVANKDLTALQKWHNIFKDNQDITNLQKLFSFMASIPVSNAATERVFSQANIIWSDTRNRLTLEHVKAEIQIKTNFNMACSEFYNYVIKNKAILKAAKSNEKYNFNKK